MREEKKMKLLVSPILFVIFGFSIYFFRPFFLPFLVIIVVCVYCFQIYFRNQFILRFTNTEFHINKNIFMMGARCRRYSSLLPFILT